MNREVRITLWIIVCLVVILAGSASSHEFYSSTRDPVSNSNCCGGNDCASIPPGWVTQDRDGFHIVLTLEQSKKVNPKSQLPIDAFVPWSRIQRSPDFDVHLCIYQSDREPPNRGVICFWWSAGV
jgi:hypothetical protein